MKDALGHGSDAGGLSGGNVSPQFAAGMLHSDHVTGGGHDSTYHGYIPSKPAGPGGDKVNTSYPHPQRAQAIARARAQLRAMMGPLAGR